jgi:hypothetical protein
LKSRNVSAVINYKSKLDKFRKMPADVDVPLPLMKTSLIEGREFSIEFETYNAMIQQISAPGLFDDFFASSTGGLLNRAQEVAIISTKVELVLRVACVGVDDAWVSGIDKTIRRVDMHESLCETVTTICQTYPNDITVSRQGELIYSDGLSRTVNTVRHGNTETLITTPQGWIPGKLCSSIAGGIVVSMCTADFSERKIVCYQGETETLEINRDRDGEPIYKGGAYALFVAENTNGDICASDRNAGIVVVANKSGRVRFRYDGAPAWRIESFIPTTIGTDTLGQIIISDYRNACIHILDMNGQFLRCMDEFGLIGSKGLSVDSEGRLWVDVSDGGLVKVIQYMK